ncbi:MAG: lysoplasmalogenase [Robiginitomaculum sp.]|nr:lysoplasmalogenase [Robiginitomaculum sp.]
MLNSPLLTLAIIFAATFLALRWRPFFALRPIIKAAMAVLLAVYCITAQPPLSVMAAGFALSALGDFFLDLRGDKYFLPGLIAFFAAHVAFAVYLFGHMVPLYMFTAVEWGISAALIASTIAFYIWLLPALPKDMKIPVAAYSFVITIMGITALTTTLPSMLVPLGAMLFIASDVVLAVEKFKFKFKFMFLEDKKINWALYAGGQILLAIGVVGVVGV